MGRPPPSDEARARLREEAAALDVEDIVDLCCSSKHDSVRVSIYLEALRQQTGGGSSEIAQLGALLLCFDLARNGDETRDVEVQLLLPIVDALTVFDPRGIVAALTGNSEAVQSLWHALQNEAEDRDRRSVPVPDFALASSGWAGAVGDDDLGIEIDLFDDDDIVELESLMDDVVVIDAEASDAYDRAFDALWLVGSRLFSAESSADLDRLERFQESARSFSSSVPMAAEAQALAALFVATHTRSHGLFGRRNKQRDALLREALVSFSNLPEPPAATAAWFIPGGDVPGAVPHAWEKMAEALLDFAGYLGGQVEGGADPARAGFVVDVVDGYLADKRSANVPQLLGPAAKDGARRRRR